MLTQRMALLPVTESHHSFLLDLFRDPQVMAFSEGFLDPIQVTAWIKQGQEAFSSPGGGAWLLTCRQDAAPLGYLNLLPQDRGWGTELWLGCRLLPGAWGRGLACEAAKAALGRAFSFPAVQCIAAAIDPENTPSLRLAARLGFRLEAHYFPAGYDHADGIYRIRTEDLDG